MSNNGLKFKREKNKFICEGFDFKIEYSKPMIQAHNELSTIKSIKDILYYYYKLKVYKHQVVDYLDEDDPNYDETNDEIWKWKLVMERDIYDFPGIFWFQNALNIISQPINKEDCQKIELRNNKYEYRYSLTNVDFIANDDIYELTKIYHYNNNISFVLFIGGSWDVQGDLNGCGIRCPYLNEADIMELKKCIDEFIKYSMELQTKDNWKYTKMCNDSFFVDGNKLYAYTRDYTHRKVYKSSLEEVFIENDTVLKDIYETIINEDKSFYHKKYNNVKIKEIKDEYIKLEDGTMIPIHNIQAIYDEFENTEPRLYYNVEQIANDFISIMNDKEKEEFKIKDIQFLLNKYKDVIINRSWMCRDEHNFEKIIKDNNVKNAEIYVEQAIKRIKEIL